MKRSALRVASRRLFAWLPEIDDHLAFQRAVLGALAVAGTAALSAWLLAGSSGALTWVAPLSATVAVGWAALTGPERRVAASVGVAISLGLAWRLRGELSMVARELTLPGLLTDLAAAGLFVLVGSVGLAGRHLRAGGSAGHSRSRFAPPLSPATAALCARAAAARDRIRAGLAGDASPDARQLQNLVNTLVREVETLATREREVAAEIAAFDPTALDERLADARARAAAATDVTARAGYDAAVRALTEQRERLAGLRASAERVTARLHLAVVLLESTAIAVAARRGAASAQEAAALGPLVDRLRELDRDIEGEASAISQVDAAG